MQHTLRSTLALAALTLAAVAASAVAPAITSGTAVQTPNTLKYLVTVTGTNFVSGDTLYINSVAQTTTFVSSTQLEVATYTAAVGTTEIAAEAEGSSGNSNSENVTVPFSKTYVVGLDAQGQIDTTDANAFDSSMAQLNDHPTGNPGVWAGAIIGVGWNQIQPGADGCTTCLDETITTTAIDTALSNIATYNSTNGTNVTAKIRVFAGTHTPAWAMYSWGGPVDIEDSSNNYQDFPTFWTTGYSSAFNNMVEQLAEKYDMDPRVQEIAITSCSSKTGEPFIYDYSDWTSISRMHTAGFTDAQMEATTA
jgi:hypothetical protein